MTNTNFTQALDSPPANPPSRLRSLNLVAGLVHLAQAIVFVLIAEPVSLPVSSTFASGPPGEPVTPERLDVLFSYELAPAVALFSLLSAVFHLVVVTPWGWRRYSAEVRHRRNRFRWVEYSLSASLMIVLIAGLTGISDIAALVSLFGVNAAMILFGWLMETTNEPGPHASWTPFVFGCLTGIVPWVAIGIYLFGAAEPPGFVYGIFVSLFVFFNCFAVNQWLQYKQIGRWRDYLTGERTYIVLSFVAKSILAWQIYANVLVG